MFARPSPPAASASPAAPVDAALVLTAACDPGAAAPSTLEVALSVPAPVGRVFQLDDEVMGAASTASLVADAAAADDRGQLPLVRRLRDGAVEFAATREPSGSVTFRYRAHAIATTETAAREGLRHDDTGIGGHGRLFLVLPDSQRSYRIRVTWGAPHCPSTTHGEGMSTFGGDAPSDLVGELTALREAVYFWGRPQRASFADGPLHLRLAWFGEPALDAVAAGAWTARALAAERAFFADLDPQPYSVFVRVLRSQDDRANGIAQETWLLSAIGPGTTFGRRLKVNLAHEMLHRWLGMRLRLGGAEGTAYWFTEGFTVHYSNRIAFRAGLLSTDEFLESLNDLATRHFDNDRAHATNDEIRRGFHRDPVLSIVPYTRGALYAAELDAAVRAASHGQRTLDDALRDLYRAAAGQDGYHGLPFDAVRRLVQTELGRAGVARYDEVIVRGGDPLPPVNAYGPCFTREPRQPNGFRWVRVPKLPEAQCRAW